MKYLFIGLAIILSILCIANSAPTDVKVAYFGPLDYPESLQYIFAYRLAIDQRASYFQNTHGVNLIKEEMSESPEILQSLSAVNQNVSVVVGPPYSGASAIACLVFGAFNIPNLSFYATGTDLSNGDKYPYFNRVMLNDAQQVRAILSLIKSYGWTRISCVHTLEDYGVGGANNLVREATALGMTVNTIQSIMPWGYGDDPTDEDYATLFDNLNDAKARIIVTYAIFPIDCTRLWNYGRKLGYLDVGYQWIVTDGCAEYVYPTNDNANGFTDDDSDFTGVLAFFPTYDAGKNYSQFYNTIINDPNYNNGSTDGTFFKGSAFSYDATNTALDALDVVLKSGSDVNGSNILGAIRGLNSQGLSGNIRFDSIGDRTNALFSLLNYYNGRFNKIGFVDPTSGNIDLLRPIIFVGDTYTPPSDYEVVKYIVSLNAILGAITGVCVLVVLFIGGVIVFQWRKFRYSSPLFCVLIILGALLGFTSIFTFLPEPTGRLCVSFPWLLGIGYCIMFGTLFTKTWRTWRLFSNARKFKIIAISNKMMFTVVGAFVLIESAFMVAWTVVDYPTVKAMPIYKSGQAQLQCSQESEAWWYVFVFYKLIYIAVGVFLAFKTRDVVDSLNESKPITMALYNLTFVMLIAIPLGFILRDYPTAVIVIQVVAILLSFTATVCLLFLPRVWLIVSGQQKSIDTRDSSYNSGGYSSQGNTSRTIQMEGRSSASGSTIILTGSQNQSSGSSLNVNHGSSHTNTNANNNNNNTDNDDPLRHGGSLRLKDPHYASIIMQQGGIVYTGGDSLSNLELKQVPVQKP